MVNLQKVNLPKIQTEHKITKMSWFVFLASWLFLASCRFGKLTFWRLTISPSIAKTGQKQGQFYNCRRRCSVNKNDIFDIL
jgi:hypothetical protein